MIVYGPSITKMSLNMIAFVLEIMICNMEIIVSFPTIIVFGTEMIISSEPSGTR